MAESDFDFGAGDSLPLVTDTMLDRDGNPIDLTGAVVTFPRQPDDGTTATVRTASIVGDPTKANVSAKAFDAGEIAAGEFFARFKAVLASGETVSWPRDRQYIVHVDPDGSGGTPAPSPSPPTWSVDGIATGARQLIASIPATDEAVVRVKTVRAEFYLDRASALVADNLTVAAAVGGGRWIRKSVGDLFWQLQTAWFYDAGAGIDEATGLNVGQPIKTMSELWRRVLGGTALTDVSVTIAGGPGSLTDAEAAVFAALSAGPRQWSLV